MQSLKRLLNNGEKSMVITNLFLVITTSFLIFGAFIPYFWILPSFLLIINIYL